jgi:hypothetical protein
LGGKWSSILTIVFLKCALFHFQTRNGWSGHPSGHPSGLSAVSSFPGRHRELHTMFHWRSLNSTGRHPPVTSPTAQSKSRAVTLPVTLVHSRSDKFMNCRSTLDSELLTPASPHTAEPPATKQDPSLTPVPPLSLSPILHCYTTFPDHCFLLCLSN